jgi:hexosaminidase
MFNFEARRAPRFHPSRLIAAGVVALATITLAIAAPAPGSCDLMPVPAELHFTAGQLPVTASFSVAVTGHDDARLRAAVARALQRLTARTGIDLTHATVSTATPAALVIVCQGPGYAVPSVAEDESYALDVTAQQATLHAPTVVGALRGLETFLQLVQSGRSGYAMAAVNVRDQPRFPWRGLMIDVARHWQPIEVIKRNLDGMALVKLNVLHLHLTEDQGFRVESRTHPELQEQGSDGHYFTQDQIRDIVAYAQARGIRVMPEFDIPGHATSWVVSHPELASLPGPYAIERQWGVFDPVLDPTNEALYRLLDDFMGEMAALFPDAYIHIGGDENNGVQWNANPRIQEFIRQHDLKDNAGLHAYFNRRLGEILAKHGKKLIGWDEILHPGLPLDSTIHSWRGVEALGEAAHMGYAGILSNGYYIDLCYPTGDHYLVAPLPATTTLTAEEQRRILGGEATMWSEWVTPETIDSRIWPRTAAIAERLWSSREVNDVADMYRRLPIISARLDEAGLLHEKNRAAMVYHLVSPNLDAASLLSLHTFIDAIEPVKHYRRGVLQPWSNQWMPLIGLADAAAPESAPAQVFAVGVDRLLFQARGLDPALAETLSHQLKVWSAAGQDVSTALTPRFPALREGAPIARQLSEASVIGLEAVAALVSGHAPDDAWRNARLAILTRDAESNASATELPMIAPLKLLVAAAAAQGQRGALSDEVWRQKVRSIAFPKKSPAVTP